VSFAPDYQKNVPKRRRVILIRVLLLSFIAFRHRYEGENREDHHIFVTQF